MLALAEEAPSLYRSFEREVKGKRRLLVESTGRLKTMQRRILDNVLARLAPFPMSFGAVKGRTIKDNARIHARSTFIAKLDIKDFYPSIHSMRVYKFFCRDQGCSPDVARLLTTLTTKDHSLPLGTSTSPALADQIVRPVDVRINAMATKAGMKYTRYVDDMTLSGSFPLVRLTDTAVKVLRQVGFKVKKSKLVLYGPGDTSERIITGVAIRDGRMSAPLNYAASLEKELREAIRQSKSANVKGDFLPREHYRGKIAYIGWLDPECGERLLRLYRRVKWRHLEWSTAQLIQSE